MPTSFGPAAMVALIGGGEGLSWWASRVALID